MAEEPTTLEKAQNALNAAKASSEQPNQDLSAYMILLQIANAQASISTATSLDRLANKFAPLPVDKHAPGHHGYV